MRTFSLRRVLQYETCGIFWLCKLPLRVSPHSPHPPQILADMLQINRQCSSPNYTSDIVILAYVFRGVLSCLVATIALTIALPRPKVSRLVNEVRTSDG